VANFCAKCGAEVSPGKQFCTACGAPVTAAPAAVMPAQPAAAPANSGASAVKIVLIVVAVFVGLGIIGAGIFGFTVWRVARSLHVANRGGQMTMNIPGTTITANPTEKFSASDLGTDIYPGAQPGKGGMRMTLPSGSMVTAIFVTPDSKDQVVSFYKGKFGSEASVFDSAKSAMITVQKGKQESVMVTVTPNASQYSGKTQITIMHTTSKGTS
jgi:zinc-ribbon domain